MPDLAPRRAAFRYYGAKWRLAPWLISKFPPHSCYVEPFGGSAAVLLQKQPVGHEVLNDVDEAIVNFFRVLRDKTDELIEAIVLTPFSRVEFERSRGQIESGSDVDRARAFYTAACQGRAGLRPNRTGWRHCAGVGRSRSAAHDFAACDHLWAVAARLKLAQLECDSALAVLDRYDRPTTLFYLDPPYPSAVRTARWGRDGYRRDMGDLSHHEALLLAAKAVSGMVAISGYDCELYADMLSGWERHDRSSQHDGGVGTESLWLSPAATLKFNEHNGDPK